ncbi:YqcC family protein [Vibrio sp. WXL210]|uniref:YqcC family protein n=1 Tax=Vibrio sp. WXL210 TaxID=3450709 RepID=UPI003EC88D46
MSRSQRVSELLLELEQAMRKGGLLQSSAPSAEKLASRQPFAIDTLTPEEWLQWIFIPRMREMINSQQPLPVGFEISPYFEQAWQPSERRALLALISELDKAFAAC